MELPIDGNKMRGLRAKITGSFPLVATAASGRDLPIEPESTDGPEQPVHLPLKVVGAVYDLASGEVKVIV